MEENFLTIEEVAKKLRMSPEGVQRLCRAKVLGASKPGRRWLIPRESLDNYLKIVR